tara:strand:+ start:2016 stop:4076 length:2061 start_codon:yes stop_codon:yes gene_type:complete
MAEYSFKADGKSYNLQTSKEYSNEEIENLYEKFSNGEKLPENVYIRPTINNRKPIIPQRVAPFASGFTSGFADEIIGGARGALDPNLTMGEGMLLEGQGLDLARQLRPVEATGTEIGGFLTSPINKIFNKREKNKGIGGKIRNRALEGGLYGIGSGKVVLEDDGSIDWVKTAGSKGLTGLRDSLIATAFSSVLVPLGNVAGNTILKNKSMSKKQGGKRAENELRKIIDESDGDIDTFFDIAIRKSKKGFTLADNEDLGADRMMIIAAKVIGESKNSREITKFFKNRNNTLNNRVKDEFELAFPNGQGLQFSTLKKLLEQRGVKADAMYKHAFKKNINIKDDVVWQDIISTPDFAQAFKEAQELAKLYKVKLPNVTIKNGKIISSKGDEVTEISTEFLHYIKMALGDAIDKGKRAGGDSGIGNFEKRGRTQNINYFLDWLDGKNPAYKKARDEFAGESEILRALDDGFNFNKIKTINELDVVFNNLSKSEQNAFRQGVFNYLEEIVVKRANSGVEGMGGNTALQIIKSEKQRDMLKIILGRKEANKLIKNLTDIVKMKNTANTILTGSKTAEKQVAIKSLDDAAKGFDSSSALQLAKQLFSSQNVLKREDLYKQGYADKVFEYITASSPEQLLKIKSDIQKTGIDKTIDNIIKILISSGKIASQATLTSPVSVGQTQVRGLLQEYTE